MSRVGIGYDVHRLEKGRKLVLGGVEIPFGSERSSIELNVFIYLLCHLTDPDFDAHGDDDL